MRIATVTLVAGLALMVTGCPPDTETETEAERDLAAEAPAPDAAAPAEEAAGSEDAGAQRAVAILTGKSGATVQGTAMFAQEGEEVSLMVHVSQGPAGTHAIHLHENGDCSAEDASSAGDHWNPTGAEHGEWGKDGHHLGDIGNLEIGEDGQGHLEFSTDQWSLGTGEENDVVGTAVVIHETQDTFEPPAGNAGGRIACGVVQQAAAGQAMPRGEGMEGMHDGGAMPRGEGMGGMHEDGGMPHGEGMEGR